MRILSFTIGLTILLLTGCQNKSQSPVSVGQIKCNGLENPEGTSNKPDFSWILESTKNNQVQTAWQILVASSAELLATDKADLWNSEKIKSNASNEKQNNNQMKRAMRNIFTPTENDYVGISFADLRFHLAI